MWEVDNKTFANVEIGIVTKSKYRLLDGRGKDVVKATLKSELSHVAKDKIVKKSAI